MSHKPDNSGVIDDLTIFDRAYEIHARACAQWPLNWPWAKGVARPFSTPDTMPIHHWRVSRDVMQELYNAMPPDYTVNPKSSFGAETRLFGWAVNVDKDAPMGTLELLTNAVP